ncbi:hypothetical protein SAMN05444001_1334, partial [Parabacteroides chinchillae]
MDENKLILIMNKLFTFIIALLLLSCTSVEEKELFKILDFADANRDELEKVLEHYKQDSLKLKATYFLIKNMLGHAGYDSITLKDLQPAYNKLVTISKKHNWERSVSWARETRAFGENIRINISPLSMQQDISTIKAD